MKLTPFQEKVKSLDKTLSSDNKKLVQWVIDNARPNIAVRLNNLVTVCFCCGNAMVYAGHDRFVKCVECGKTVKIIESKDWLASKRMAFRDFASLEVVDGIQLIRTYKAVLRYNAINRLMDCSACEICRHWITSDGRYAVTSCLNRCFIERLVLSPTKMKLCKGSTEVEDHLANAAFVLPDIALIPELSQKIGKKLRELPVNALATILNTLEPDYSII